MPFFRASHHLLKQLIMKQWRTILSEINNALAGYSFTVLYLPPTGRKNQARCSEFLINVLTYSQPDFEDVKNALGPVCSNWTLALYSNCPEIELMAHWDIKK